MSLLVLTPGSELYNPRKCSPAKKILYMAKLHLYSSSCQKSKEALTCLNLSISFRSNFFMWLDHLDLTSNIQERFRAFNESLYLVEINGIQARANEDFEHTLSKIDPATIVIRPRPPLTPQKFR